MARRTFKLGGPLLSVIIPTTHEVETLFFERAVASLANFKNIEVICISQSEAVTRAERLNQGLHKSCGSMILLLRASRMSCA